jgi:DnaJ domain
MESTPRKQRRRAHRKAASASVIRIEVKDGMGNPRWVAAGLVDIIDGGCGVELTTSLESGSTVVMEDHLTAGVRWCIRKTDGTFRAGLEFLSDPDRPDLYEAMQLSPNADADTIARVYRMLAFRYHPDNAETGNSEMFIRLSEAHRVLSDPEKRASYDARRRHASGFPASQRGRRHLEAVTAAYLGINSLGCTEGSMCWEA